MCLKFQLTSESTSAIVAKGNVLHVGTPPGAEDLDGLILPDQSESLRRHRQYCPR